MPRVGEVQDIANLALFLLSDAAGWITGQMINVDDVRIEGLDRIEFGHSAEMMVPPSALLEPYDLKRQFDIHEQFENGPVEIRQERIAEVQSRPAATH